MGRIGLHREFAPRSGAWQWWYNRRVRPQNRVPAVRSGEGGQRGREAKQLETRIWRRRPQSQSRLFRRRCKGRWTLSPRGAGICARARRWGARAAIAGTGLLELEVPRADKRLLVIVETDGCFVDGVEAVTDVSVGRRTLRVEDYGKIAATFVDVKTERALRVAPRVDVRERAWDYAPEQKRRYFAMLHGYQRMPDAELFSYEWVELGEAGRRDREPGRGAGQLRGLRRRDYQRAGGRGGWRGYVVPVLRRRGVLLGQG